MTRMVGLSVTLCVAVGVAACGSTDATGPEGSQAAAAPSASAVKPLGASQNQQRPVKGYIEGSDQYGDACGDGQGVLITSTGIGTVSHFGNSVMVATTCVNLSDFSAIGPAPFSIQAANGDEVGGVLTDVVYTDYGFDLYTSIPWGTGRFAGATGALVFPTTSTGTGVWTSGVEGWISY